MAIGLGGAATGRRVLSAVLVAWVVGGAVAAEGLDLAYVAHGDWSGVGVSVVDLRSAAVVGVIPIIGTSARQAQSNLGDAVASSDGTRVFISLSRFRGVGSVLEIDTARDEIVGVVELDDWVVALAVSEDPDTVFALTSNSIGSYTVTVHAIDLPSQSVSTLASFSGRGIDIAATPSGSRLFITTDAWLTVLETATGATDVVDLSDPPYAFEGGVVVLGPGANTAYVGTSRGLRVVDVVRGDVGPVLDLGRAATDLAVSDDGRLVYRGDRGLTSPRHRHPSISGLGWATFWSWTGHFG